MEINVFVRTNNYLREIPCSHTLCAHGCYLAFKVARLTLWTPCKFIYACIYTQLLLSLHDSVSKKCVDRNVMMHANDCCTCNLIST